MVPVCSNHASTEHRTSLTSTQARTSWWSVTTNSKAQWGGGVTADGMQADKTSRRAPLAARCRGEALEYRSAENTPHGALARANVIGREYPPPAGAGAPSGAPRTKSFLRRGRASSGPAAQLEAYPAFSFEIFGRNSSAAADPASTAGIVVWTELQQVPSHPDSVEPCRQGRSTSRSIQSTRRKGSRRAPEVYAGSCKKHECRGKNQVIQ